MDNNIKQAAVSIRFLCLLSLINVAISGIFIDFFNACFFKITICLKSKNQVKSAWNKNLRSNEYVCTDAAKKSAVHYLIS